MTIHLPLWLCVAAPVMIALWLAYRLWPRDPWTTTHGVQCRGCHRNSPWFSTKARLTLWLYWHSVKSPKCRRPQNAPLWLRAAWWTFGPREGGAA